MRYGTFVFLSAVLINSAVGQILNLDAENVSFIDASAFISEYESIFFFSGNMFMIYELEAEQQSDSVWYELPNLTSVDAALSWSETEIMLFSGNHYRILDLDSLTVPADSTLWPGLPEAWHGKLDACVRWSEDEVYFFLGSEYFVYNFALESHTIFDEMSVWEGYPENWESGLEAVFNVNGSIYFMNDGEAAMYDRTERLFYGPEPVSRNSGQ